MDLNLKKVYEDIANEFDQTRQRVWSCVGKFLDTIERDSLGLEIGCGNGKNMLYRGDLNMVGIDFCETFVNMCKDKNLSVIQGDMRNLPFNNDIFDFSISVAVLHHLYKRENRLQALKEQLRVTKSGGKILILVWALNQENGSVRKFKNSDEMVSWKKKDGNIVYRYYHLYKEEELLEDIYNIKGVEISDYFNERGNWCIILNKI